MNADLSAAITAIATLVLAIAAIGAFIYAARTYQAQSRQLEIAKDETRRLRTPVFEGHITLLAIGYRSYVVSLRLLSNEGLASLSVVLEGATLDQCPLGFFPGGDGVKPIELGELPKGWGKEVVRPDASWGLLMPGATATWRADSREGHPEHIPRALHGRAECRGITAEEWTVYVTFEFTGDLGETLLYANPPFNEFNE